MRTLLVALTLLVSASALASDDAAEAPADRHPLIQQIGERLDAWRSSIDPLSLVRWHPAAAFGRAGKGKLLFGVRMEPTPGIHLRNPNEAWTVPEVVQGLRDAHAAVQKAHPGGPDMVVGDISRRHGGRFRPHRSHQNGLDVDLRYYLLGEQPADYKYRHVTGKNFDTARVWTLVAHLYTEGKAERILIDYRHQRRLYRYARDKLNLSPEQLEPILSYPKARSRKDALVRHARGHHNHIHIRFDAPLARLIGSLYTPEAVTAAQRAVDLAILGQYDYVVRRGDTLSGIAAANEVTVADLRAWNGLGNRSRLRPGKVLKVLATN